MLRFFIVAAAALTFAACGGNQPTDHAGHDHDHAGHDHAHGHDHNHAGHENHHPSNENATTPDGVHYGTNTAVTADGTTPLADVIAKLQSKQGLAEVSVGDGEEAQKVQGITVKVEGTVSDVCKKAGCWFKLATTDGKEMFFRMKDHKGVPLDLVGQTVVAEGKAYESITPVDELRHYAEDKGASKEEIAAITQPKTEYRFYAEGVLLKK